MAPEEKKIIVDDDWKQSARREQERLAQEQEAAGPMGLPPADFSELLNIVAMQAMAGFGLMAGPDGRRIPADMGVAKHFIDLLQVVDDKTKGNLTDEEKNLLDHLLYELRMRYVELSSGGAGLGSVPSPDAPPPTTAQ